MPEKTILEWWHVLAALAGAIATTVASHVRVQGKVDAQKESLKAMKDGFDKDIANINSTFQRFEQRIAAERKEDNERVAESRRETNATLSRIFDKLDDLHKDLKDQGRGV